MKKRQVFGIMALALAFILLVSGCAMKKSSNTAGGAGDYHATAGNEAQGTAKNKSLLDKYIRKAGKPYTAHDYMIKYSYTEKY